MWKFIKKYIHFAILGAVLMIFEVLMDLLQPSIMSRIVDDGVLGVNNEGVGDLGLIINLGITMIILVLIGCLCGSLNNVFVNLASHNIGNELRKASYRKIMTFSFPQIDHFTTGSLITRMTNDITQVQSFFSMFARGLVRTGFMTIGSIYFMFRLDPEFGLVVLIALPFVIAILSFFLTKLTAKFTILQEQLDQINSLLQEDLSNIRIIKACVQELYVKVKFGQANIAIVATQIFIMTILAFINPIINLLMAILISIVLIVGSVDVAAGVTSPGNIMAGITYLTQLLHAIMMLIMLFQGMSRGKASLNRIKEILNTEPEIKGGDYIPENGSIRGEVEFLEVSFSYPDDEQAVLKRINLKIKAGETVAIMGSTGSGKSSLINLISRFYDVTSGNVLIDGVNVKEYSLDFLRSKIAYTLQKSELFSTSIAENIRWGDPNANSDEIIRAAKVAQADQFIMEQGEQYETVLAENGKSLSGGQKQRVSIARSVLKNAPIMIFDDSTSALDLSTESKFFKALAQYNEHSTKIIVAQRISSVIGVDRIIMIDQGVVVAMGKHRELLKDCKIYQDLYRSQIGDEAIL